MQDKKLDEKFWLKTLWLDNSMHWFCTSPAFVHIKDMNRLFFVKTIFKKKEEEEKRRNKFFVCVW